MCLSVRVRGGVVVVDRGKWVGCGVVGRFRSECGRSLLSLGNVVVRSVGSFHSRLVSGSVVVVCNVRRRRGLEGWSPQSSVVTLRRCGCLPYACLVFVQMSHRRGCAPSPKAGRRPSNEGRGFEREIAAVVRTSERVDAGLTETRDRHAW